MSADLVYTPIFGSIYEFAKVLPMEEGYSLLMACCAYANGEDLPEMSDLVRVIFENDARSSIDRTLNKVKRNRENGKRHAKANQDGTEPEPKVNPTETQDEPKANPNGTQDEPKANPNDDMINDQRSMINKDLKSRKIASNFAPPTVDEVRAYGEGFCRDRGIPPGGFSAERFVAFYDSKGWRVGDHEMKSWRRAAANWILKDHPEAERRGQRGQPDKFDRYN